jgi:hypothetical protein
VVAGESAHEVARKRRDKAARLNRVADAYEKGAEGERRTANALAMLPASGWFVLHDVRWPGKRFANIDHVVVGPGGVFVIDSKAWSGVVEVRDGVLRQNGNKREEAVASAADAAMAVAEQVPGLDPCVAKPVLCFVGDHELEGWARDVMLCTPANLVAMLMSRPQVLDAAAVRRTLLGLQEALKSATAAPLPSSRRTPSAAARATTTRPPKRSGAARTIVRLLGFLVFVGLMFAGLRELPGLATPLSHLFTSGVSATPTDSAHARPLSSTQHVSAGAHRPPLWVTADRAITVHRVGPLPYLIDGNRFFAVRLTITNRGEHPWTSQPGTTAHVLDSYDIPHPSAGSVRIREGRVLPDTIHVAPGQTVRGYEVFQVSRTTPITGFTLTVGPGEPRTASWTIDRQ